ncbi:hypothetical protein ACS0TY_017784 [Phlomoides rotata]
MPAQTSPRENITPPPSLPPPLDPEKCDDPLQSSDNHNEEQPDNAYDSDGSSNSSGGEKDEFIVVKLGEVCKEVQCAICLGIIRKTRTVMECLHRFCRECIDKSMRLGNNECPACRTHCASRRSLRDDPNYDALIAALYPDFDKPEEEQELVFHEEERDRNNQIQGSIAQTLRRQMEAQRTSVRATGATLARRQGSNRNLRGRRNHRAVDRHGSDEEEGAFGHYYSEDSSADENSAEPKSKRYKRWAGARTSQPSSEANADGSIEFLAWGRGGMRSSIRHGDQLANDRISRSNRLSKLTNRLRSFHEDNEVFETSLVIVSLHEEKIPNLKRPYLCCSPTSSVRHLCQVLTSILILDLSFILTEHVLNSFKTTSCSMLLCRHPWKAVKLRC